MAVINLGNKIDPNDPNRKRRVIDLETGEIREIEPEPQQPQQVGETAQQRAARYGAEPGIAVTRDQEVQIGRGQQITPPERAIDPNADYRPRPEADPDSNALARSYVQGWMNVGGGVLRGYGELVKMMGKEGADKFLADLAASQTMEQRETDLVTRNEPVQRFIGEAGGEVSAFPWGGGGSTLLSRVPSAMFAGGAAGALSAAGRGGEGTDVALETALGAGLAPLADLGAVGFRRFQNSRSARAAGGVDPDQGPIAEAAEQVQQAQQGQAATGVRLLPAQQTLDPFMIEKQAFLGQHPEVARKAFNVLKQQNREAAGAVESLLNVIAIPESVGTAGNQARRTAGNIIDSAKLARDEATSPIYRQAFVEGAEVNLGGVNDVITSIIEGLPEGGSRIRNTMLRVRSMMKPRERVAPDGSKYTAPPSLKQLHNAKLEIDQMLSAKFDDSLGNTTKNYLMQVKSELLSAMEQASPTYAAARAEFRRLSPAVDNLQDGVFGRIADLDTAQLRQASSILFDAAETNPQVLREALKTLKSVDGGSDLARALLRTEMERRLGRMRVGIDQAIESGGRNLENIPQNLLNTLFGNTSQRKVLFAGLMELSPEAARNAKWLEDTLARAATGRPGGSQTGIRNEMMRRMRGASLAIRNFFRHPIESVTGISEEAMFNQKVRAMGEALYNPDWAPDMEKIRKLNPNSPEAASQFERLLNTILEQNLQFGVSSQAAAAAGRQSMKDEPQVFGGRI